MAFAVLLAGCSKGSDGGLIGPSGINNSAVAETAMVPAGSGARITRVQTDQDDYSPGSVVTISGDNSDGAGYLPDETVVVNVNGPNGFTAQCQATVGPTGVWSCQITLWDSYLAVGSYAYTATGQTSGATEVGAFTDAAVGARLSGGPTSATMNWVHHTGNAAGAAICNGNTQTPGTTNLSDTAFNAVATVNSNHSIRLTAPVIPGYTFVEWVLEWNSTTSATNPICLQGISNGGAAQQVTARYAPALNIAPSITSLTGPSPVAEHAATQRTYSFSFTDPDANTWTFAAGYPNCGTGGSLVVNSGTINQGAKTGEFKCVFDDGPATPQVSARISDGQAQSGTATFDVTVDNVAPTAALGNDGPVIIAAPATIAFTGQTDPSSADTAAGFRYAFSCANDTLSLPTTYAAAGGTASTTCTFNTAGDHTVAGRIFDKNDGYTTYTTVVTVRYAICYLYDNTKAAQAGSTVPIKFYLCDANGANVSSPAVVVTATSLVKLDASASGVLEDSGYANPDSNFRYDAELDNGNGGYIFNLSTRSPSPALGQRTKLTTGTWRLNFTVDGVSGYWVKFDVK